MIELSEAAQDVLTRSYRMHLAVESWLGDELLSDAVPVDSGGEETDRTSNVPERVTLTVPRRYRGESWTPIAADHPLAANGQRLRVQLGIELAGGTVEWFQRGWFLIEESAVDGDSVSVEAVGLLALIDEARLVTPYQPSGTFVSTLRGLVEPALTVVVDPALTDRSVPSGLNFDDDRLGAVMELLDAWPADAMVTPDGYLSVVPAVQSQDSVLLITDLAGGTIIEATGGSSRDGAASVVVARGTASDGGQVQGVAYAQSGPTRISGPFNPLPVPFYYESPLLTTAGQCSSAAATILARRMRETAVELNVEMVPHPGLQAGDTVRVSTVDHPDLLCSVEALSLPYTADGPQQLTVRSLT
ncbi:DUF5047 domain-containing protein [Micromonospora sp. WMMD1102]|uniref:DUF5047 domain-containing protein n=1 Tax=Micromonospora sp. WMMD1102 TaxID=3016105 RepID=UPI002414DA18|nr:DUF5047 domain-containing protein [Micromonospora sp. WMMD1102]MDG4790368.1 DUF5047 domain-containing protein [Micromonospora sp. WMMD1102]